MDDDIQIVDVIRKPNLITQSSSSKQIMDSEKPLLNLIKHLVNFMNTEKTVLTNSQLMAILYKEFDFDIWKLAPLEAEIYMNVLKKFLKSWPKWDQIDLHVQKAKLDKTINIESILYNEYESLKIYLMEKLNSSRKPTQEALSKLNQQNAKLNEETKESKEKDGILEISCLRRELNTLFYERPNPQLNNTIFHLKTSDNTSKISVTSSSYDEIFNCPLLNFNMDIGFFDYTRKNHSQFKHTLVNFKLGSLPAPPPVNLNVLSKHKYKSFKKERQISSQITIIFIEQLIAGLEKLKRKSKAQEFLKQLEIACHLLKVMKKDLSHAPEYLDRSLEYKYALNRYPYVRYLSTPVKDEGTNQNQQDADGNLHLALQEYIVPSVIFNVDVKYFTNYESKKGSTNKTKFQMDSKIFNKFLDTSTSWLRVECGICAMNFSGPSSAALVKQHFDEKHIDEKDWTCCNCEKIFTMKYLGAHNWFHQCPRKN